MLYAVSASFAHASASDLQECAAIYGAPSPSAERLEAPEVQFPYFSAHAPKDWPEIARGYFLRQASETDQAGVWFHASPDHEGVEIADDLESIFDVVHMLAGNCVVTGAKANWRIRRSRSEALSLSIAYGDVGGVGYAIALSSNDRGASFSSLTKEVLLPILSSFTPRLPEQKETDLVTIFITRHAEKDEAVETAPLKAQGEERANLLSDMLANSDIAAVYATEALRTQQTAAPLAVLLDLEVTTAATTNLDGFVGDVLSKYKGRNVLIVSHSHTIPALLESFGVSAPPYILATEYDNLYIVHASQDGEAFFSKMRYGAPSAQKN